MSFTKVGEMYIGDNFIRQKCVNVLQMMGLLICPERLL